MTDIAKAFKSEISRLSRKEIRATINPLVKQTRDLKKLIRAQNQRIQELERSLAGKMDKKDTGQIQPELVKDKPQQRIRTSPDSIKRHRKRLKLSQKNFGLLLGVSTLTVSKWETGHAKPRGRNKEAFALIRQIRPKEAKARLEQLQGV
ncbi:MAG: helix-turn-helix domain-containing protein [Fidelibacterota bacterium]